MEDPLKDINKKPRREPRGPFIEFTVDERKATLYCVKSSIDLYRRHLQMVKPTDKVAKRRQTVIAKRLPLLQSVAFKLQ